MIRRLHSLTAREVNARDGVRDRMIWFQYRETCLTYEGSYFTRLHYVHRNPVHHKLVREATRYPWCSAAWFEREAPRAHQKAVFSTRCEGIRIEDEFEVVAPEDDDSFS
jgi:putative transposase